MESNRKRNILVDLFVMTFGISAWIGITGTFLQLPQMVQTAPEGWNLPSYIVILTQSGNIVSFIYIIYEKWSCIKFNDVNLIYFTLGIGCLAAILMAFFYQNTIFYANQEHSVPLFIFTSMFAIVGCLSSVLFMPFMGQFRGIYLATYMFGQGLNGLLSSILSLIQGVGSSQCQTDKIANETSVIHSEPLFEPRIYFLFLFVIYVLSSIAFILLNKLRLCKKEYSEANHCNDNNNASDKNTDDYQAIATNTFHLSSMHFFLLIFIIGAISFLTYGVLPGLQSFSCLSYGTSAYHLSTTLSSLANPLACLVSLYISRTTVSDITILSATTTIFSVYILITAIASPTPPLYESSIGNWLIISVWTMYTGFATFIKLSILQLFRCHGHNALKWAGAVIQFSSCIGAIFVFFLVNKTELFTTYDPCKMNTFNQRGVTTDNNS